MQRECDRKTTEVKTTGQEPAVAEEGEITQLLGTVQCKTKTLVSQPDTTSLPPSYEEAQLHHYITKLT